jgi:hypothetical protein
MKGYFSIMYDYYTEEINFGNLGPDVNSLGFLTDALSEGSFIGKLIAHDVIEHSVSHRTNKYVSWESEIRAFGAISFVREGEQFNLWSELAGMCESLNREIKPVPFIVGKFLLAGWHVEVDLMRELVKSGISPTNARNIAYQFAWGRLQKEEQFNDQYSARSAFSFIESNIIGALEDLKEEELKSTGISVFFDTVKHIFRWQFKRQ